MLILFYIENALYAENMQLANFYMQKTYSWLILKNLLM